MPGDPKNRPDKDLDEDSIDGGFDDDAPETAATPHKLPTWLTYAWVGVAVVFAAGLAFSILVTAYYSEDQRVIPEITDLNVDTIALVLLALLLPAILTSRVTARWPGKGQRKQRRREIYRSVAIGCAIVGGLCLPMCHGFADRFFDGKIVQRAQSPDGRLFGYAAKETFLYKAYTIFVRKKGAWIMHKQNVIGADGCNPNPSLVWHPQSRAFTLAGCYDSQLQDLKRRHTK